MKTYYVIEIDDEKMVHEYSNEISMSSFFRLVSKEISMSDCTGISVVKIVYKDEAYVYTGWNPGELFIYKGSNGSTWEGCYPEFDH